jgi:hypothetical protein
MHFGNSLRIILFSRVSQKTKHKNHADQGVYDYNYDKVMLMFNSSLDTNIAEFKEIINTIS